MTQKLGVGGGRDAGQGGHVTQMGLTFGQGNVHGDVVVSFIDFPRLEVGETCVDCIRTADPEDHPVGVAGSVVMQSRDAPGLKYPAYKFMTANFDSKAFTFATKSRATEIPATEIRMTEIWATETGRPKSGRPKSGRQKSGQSSLRV